MQVLSKIISVGTANPPKSYTQDELIALFHIDDPHIVRLFKSTHIDKRHLYMPPADAGIPAETQKELLDKHLNGALEIGSKAIANALEGQGIQLNQIDFFCVVTSTGFLLPTLTAHFMKDLPFRDDCQRLDIVGMGCNAGLNGLCAVNNWAAVNPDRYALLLCVEICSAMYVSDGTLRTSVVNSLFGDGAAAVLIKADTNHDTKLPKLLGFNSYIITEAIDAMRVHWDEKHQKFSFLLHHSNPYVVGKEVEKPVKKLLDKFNLHQGDIAHWIIHGGGKNVISAVKLNLGLTSHDMRHTTTVLRDYGNLSSASFLFSYQRLLQENIAAKGDYGVAVTIGPGAQLETALIQW